MKRKFRLIIGLLLALVVTGGVYAFTYLSATATMDVVVAGAEIATSEPSPVQPAWISVLPYTATEILRPIAAGDKTLIANQFPVTGAHCDKVDEVTSDGDTTYVWTDTDVWQEDLFHIADTLVGSGDINYVKVFWVGKAEVTPTQTSTYGKIKTGGAEYNSPAASITTSYATYSATWIINPQTLHAWTWSDVNALQIGIGLRRPTSPRQYTRVT